MPLKADYGKGGNLLGLTVHAQCTHATTNSCKDPGGTNYSTRRTALSSGCRCAREQYYVYRWDELNRLAEARRYDQSDQSGWWLKARQRYRYDGGNQRTLKQNIALGDNLASGNRAALYVYPGDFERRGLVAGSGTWDVSPDGLSESQYMVAGARVVWKNRTGPTSGLDADHRITVNLSNLIGSTSAVLDLVSGELVEAGGFYPNGAREELLGAEDALNGAEVPIEPAGFTGKEAEEEVGLTYFGERYLVPRLGRWATPDPLSIHAVGGGEALNAFHYVSGNLLQARDPLGLEGAHASPTPAPEGVPRLTPGGDQSGGPSTQIWGIKPDGTPVQPPSTCAEASASCTRDFMNEAWRQRADVYVYRDQGANGSSPKAPSEHPNLGALTGPGTTNPNEAGNHHGLDPKGESGGCKSGVCDPERDTDVLASPGRPPKDLVEGLAALKAHLSGDRLSAASTWAPGGAAERAGDLTYLAAGALGAWSAKLALRAGSYGGLRSAGAKDAHHVIQDAAVRDVRGYSRSAAPAVELPGPSTRVGSPHYNATQVQRQAGGGTYAAERRIGYKALRKAGLSPADARAQIQAADDYFGSLGVNPSTPTRIPGNR